MTLISKMPSAIAIAATLVLVSEPSMASDWGHRGPGRPAACYSANPTTWAPLSSVAAKLSSSGYHILRLRMKYGCYEARVTDAKGAYAKLYLDASNGAIIGRRNRY